VAYTISTKRSARKAIDKIPQRKARERVEDAIEDLGEEPRPLNSKKLQGKLQGKHSIYRRIDVGGVGGEYRIIYEVRDDDLIVVVVIVAQREGIYEMLKRLG
jgi:mRNA interferase RelE/StbE